jgi:hypothetical protein
MHTPQPVQSSLLIDTVSFMGYISSHSYILVILAYLIVASKDLSLIMILLRFSGGSRLFEIIMSQLSFIFETG